MNDEDRVISLARRTVDRMTHAQVCRIAALDPDAIALSLSPDTEAELDARAIARLRVEIARLCRARRDRAA